MTEAGPTSEIACARPEVALGFFPRLEGEPVRILVFVALCGALVTGAARAETATNAQQLALNYQPWMKVCGPEPGDGGRDCVTSSSGSIASGKNVVSVSIIARPNDEKHLKVVLPLGMQLVHGTRLILDTQQPVQQPYMACFSTGCVVDYPVDEEFVRKIRTGQNLVVQAVNANGAPLTLPIPLAGFDTAYTGNGRDLSELGSDAQKIIC